MRTGEAEIIKALTGKDQPFKSPFAEGLEAAASGIAWSRCPYVGENQDYERGEWLRGHSSHLRYFV